MNEKIHAHMRKQTGYKYSVTFDELPEETMHTDESEPLGTSEGPSAAMMLSAAVGHCLSSSLQFCIDKSRGSVKDLRTDVETSMVRNEKGRWRVGEIKVKMNVSVDDSEKNKLDKCKAIFEDFCIVTASVREGIKIDVEVIER